MGAERSGCSRMRIGLIDVDGHNFPNIPLMKLAAWHKQHGDTVEWYEPLFSGHMDRVYMSKVFGFTEDYPYFVDADEVIRGGSGYCIELTEGRERYIKERDKELPPEVEHIYPDYSMCQMARKKGMKEAKATGQQVSESDTAENSMNPPEVRAGDDYETPHPEGITSICYSCTEYETCNVKTGTCTSSSHCHGRCVGHGDG